MKKTIKVLLSTLCVTALASPIPFGAAKQSITSVAANSPLLFSSQIRALTPYDGESVTMNTTELNLWWDSETIDFDLLNGLYAYTDGHDDFKTYVEYTDSANVAKLLKVFDETDDFKPVNNVLKWTDTLENVASYTVRIALDSKFTKTVQKVENANPETGVILQNPFSDTEYFWQVIAHLEQGGKTYSPVFSFETDFSVRTVDFEGISNTRDVGGYYGEYGYVQQGLVYRSARLETITDNGKAAFTALGMKSDLDLRGEHEATHGANKRDPLNFGEQYFLFDTPYYASDTKTTTSGSGINNSNYFPTINGIMSVFADKNNYPIDMHCAVGRDRTGTIAMLLKSLIGISEEDSRKDYYTSMFSTTGALLKDQIRKQDLGLDSLFGYLNSFAGETLADKTATFLIDCCGMSQTQIDTIRNIMLGKDGYEVETVKTFSDTDNYEGYSFVRFQKFGVTAQTLVVANGDKVSAPFALEDGYAWTLNGVPFDLETPISQDVTLLATKTELYEVKVNNVNDGNSYTVQIEKNGNFDFSVLEKDGFTATVFDEHGNELSEFCVKQDCTINVLYTKA